LNLRVDMSLLPWKKALFFMLLLAMRSAGAHEFWLQPDRYQVEPGASVSLQLFVGENFSGDLIGIGAPALVRAEHYAARRKTDLSPVLPPAVAAALPLRLSTAGTHLVALDTHPTTITLASDKFNEYLQMEGLQAVIDARAATGASDSPGRERYRRNIKTLVNVGGTSDGTFSRRSGQRLEIVPLTDPFRLAPGSVMSLQVFFDNAPLRGALVKLWHRGGAKLQIIERRTDSRGRMDAPLPAAGEWMASVVHMTPVRGEPGLDWDSYWGNLTLAVGGALSAR